MIYVVVDNGGFGYVYDTQYSTAIIDQQEVGEFWAEIDGIVDVFGPATWKFSRPQREEANPKKQQESCREIKCVQSTKCALLCSDKSAR